MQHHLAQAVPLCIYGALTDTLRRLGVLKAPSWLDGSGRARDRSLAPSLCGPLKLKRLARNGSYMTLCGPRVCMRQATPRVAHPDLAASRRAHHQRVQADGGDELGLCVEVWAVHVVDLEYRTEQPGPA